MKSEESSDNTKEDVWHSATKRTRKERIGRSKGLSMVYILSRRNPVKQNTTFSKQKWGKGATTFTKKRRQNEKTDTKTYRELKKKKDEEKTGRLSKEKKDKILSYGPRFKVEGVEIMFFKGVANNRPSNIKLLLANEGIAPWRLPHIGFFEKENIMEVMNYIDDRKKVRDTLEKFDGGKKIEGMKPLYRLSPTEMDKPDNRMDKVKNIRGFSKPDKRFLKIFKKQ